MKNVVIFNYQEDSKYNQDILYLIALVRNIATLLYCKTEESLSVISIIKDSFTNYLRNMKHLFIFPLVFLFSLSSCTKPVTSSEQENITDSTLTHIFHATLDSTRTIMEVKDDILQLIDTMQCHVEHHPDINIRIGAKSLAGTLLQLMMDETINTPEEVTFTIDTLLMPFTNVITTWYYDTTALETLGYSCLNQAVIKYEEYDDANHISILDVILSPEKESLALTLPDDPVVFVAIAFSNGIDDINGATFSREDALDIQTGEHTSEKVYFGQEMIDAMLSHDVMYIAYTETDPAKNKNENFHSCMVLLDKFQQQYKSVKSKPIKQ